MKQFVNNIKEKITLENLLCLFIIICPILDMVSFIFRNYFNTSFSPATFLRPILSITVIIIIFFKDKMKLEIIGVGTIYAIYAIIHLWIFTKIKSGSSFGGITNELQFIINYSFMILNLFIYIHIFKNKSKDKLKRSVLISTTIYIVSIWIAIFTGTSSNTYVEGIGYKGWFETGNSIGAILILASFIILNMIKEKKYRYWALITIILVGIYTTTMLGTRVGLFGFIIAIVLYAISEILIAVLRKIQLNKKILIGSICTVLAVIIVVIAFGSNTLQRRQHLKEVEAETTTHISSGILEIKEKIDNNELEEGYMDSASKKSILDLYNYANKYKIKNNDMRMQQLIYNAFLVKNQSNILFILFGNGFQANYNELILEMEIPAFVFNFGFLGFVLYFVPIFGIFIYAIYIGIKEKRNMDTEYVMLVLGILLGFCFSFLSGYTFFHSSSMMMLVVLTTLLVNKIQELKERDKIEKDIIWNNKSYFRRRRKSFNRYYK